MQIDMRPIGRVRRGDLAQDHCPPTQNDNLQAVVVIEVHVRAGDPDLRVLVPQFQQMIGELRSMVFENQSQRGGCDVRGGGLASILFRRRGGHRLRRGGRARNRSQRAVLDGPAGYCPASNHAAQHPAMSLWAGSGAAGALCRDRAPAPMGLFNGPRWPAPPPVGTAAVRPFQSASGVRRPANPVPGMFQQTRWQRTPAAKFPRFSAIERSLPGGSFIQH